MPQTLRDAYDGLFGFAEKEVWRVSISGTETALPKHSMVFQRTTATVEVLPPVSVAGLTAADAPALAERVRSDIARALRLEAKAS